MTRPIFEPSLPRTDRKLGFSADQLFRRPAPTTDAAADWAILAIPDGQTVPTASLEVVINYDRSDTSGTSLTLNAATGLITITEAGIYDIHSWAEWDNEGAWTTVEGPVFQAGQDFQDISNGLHDHISTTYVGATVKQHKTTFFVADLPQSVNLQVAHNRGVDDDLVNGGLTVVKIGSYPP